MHKLRGSQWRGCCDPGNFRSPAAGGGSVAVPTCQTGTFYRCAYGVPRGMYFMKPGFVLIRNGKPSIAQWPRARLAEVAAAAGRPQPRVYFEEWDDPLITGFGWVSELIEIAGGRTAGDSRCNRIGRCSTPSCSPKVGLTLESMSSTIPLTGRRAWTRSIQRPDRSVKAETSGVT